MSTTTTFKATNGKDASGEIRVPSGAGKAPALVLVQEYWGINDHVRSLADRLAAEGFLVVAPDLYHGKVAKNADEGGGLMGALDHEQARADLGGAAAFLKEHPRSDGKVGIIGFCMGGMLTFVAAATVPGFSAAVPFYGIPDLSKVDLSKISIPLQAHFSKTDPWAKPSLAEEVQKKLLAKGGTMDLYVYDAEHAFMNDTRPEVHSPENAKTAWSRAMAFLKKHLS